MRKPRTESKLKQNIRNFFLLHPLIPYKTVSGKILTHDAIRVLISCVYDVDDSFYYDRPVLSTDLDSYLSKPYAKHPMNHIEIYSALQYLKTAGLIEDMSGTSDNFKFQATHEGIHYFELRRKSFIYIFMNSVILPIIISILTTLIALRFNA